MKMYPLVAVSSQPFPFPRRRFMCLEGFREHRAHAKVEATDLHRLPRHGEAEEACKEEGAFGS